jgi:pentatricopeptide repeat protein
VDVESAQRAVAASHEALAARRADEALETASAALAIVEQPLLPEFEGAWLEECRRRLVELSGPLVEVAVAAGVRSGGAALVRAEQIARRSVQREPFRESAHVTLMHALASRGDTAEALRAFDDLRVRLRDELGVSPSRELLDLHQRLLTDEPVASRSAAI